MSRDPTAAHTGYLWADGCRSVGSNLSTHGRYRVPGYFRVFLDGMDVGELWADQGRTFEVVPGQHGLRLMQFVIRRGSVAVSVEEGQGLELAYSRLAVFGLFGLHPATPKKSQRIRELDEHRERPTPRDLGGRDGSSWRRGCADPDSSGCGILYADHRR